MDPTYEYLWAAGYDLPPISKPIAEKPFVAPRRGKKSAAAKRRKAKS